MKLEGINEDDLKFPKLYKKKVYHIILGAESLKIWEETWKKFGQDWYNKQKQKRKKK